MERKKKKTFRLTRRKWFFASSNFTKKGRGGWGGKILFQKGSSQGRSSLSLEKQQRETTPAFAGKREQVERFKKKKGKVGEKRLKKSRRK